MKTTDKNTETTKKATIKKSETMKKFLKALKENMIIFSFVGNRWMIDFKKFNSMKSITNYFTVEKCCLTLMQARWMNKDGELYIECPYCHSHKCTIMKNGRIKCNGCHRNFSETVKTIFASTKISLKDWFIMMYILSSDKRSHSTCEIARDWELSQKTVWFDCQKIKAFFAQGINVLINDTKVEMDETYVGGSEKNKHESKKTEGNQGRSTKTKAPVFGMIGKDSKHVIAQTVKDTTMNELKPIVKQYIVDNVDLFS